MSKTTRKARAAEAHRGSIAADHRIVIEHTPSSGAVVVMLRNEEPSAAAVRLAEDEFAHLPLFVVRSRIGARARVWRGSDGKWWRAGGMVHIRRWPDAGGERAFVVFLFKGANEGDLNLLLDFVKRARTGVGFDAEWRKITSPWADEYTFALALNSRRYADPYTSEDRSQRVVVCDDALCVEKWHTVHGRHELDGVSKKLPDCRGSYQVSVTRELDADAWTVDVYTDDFYGAPEDVAGFVSDLQWMQEACRRANTPKHLEAVTAA